MIKAHFEPTGGIVRIGEEFEWGSDFSQAFAIVGDELVATIKGLTSTAFGITDMEKRAMLTALQGAGFKAVQWRRHKGARVQNAYFDLRELASRWGVVG